MRSTARYKIKIRYWILELKLPLAMTLVHIMLLMFMCLKDKGSHYLPVFWILLFTMWTGCLLARLCHGSQNLVAWVLILLTVGGVMQVMLMGEDAADGFRLCRKFAAAFVLSAAGVTAFYKMSWYKKEHAVAGMACLSLMIFGIMFLFGSDVGDGAVVNLKVGTRSFQVLELLKVLYIFVMAGLLGKEQLKDKQVMGLKRPWAAFIFTVLNIGFLALLGELGTALLIAALGGGMFLAGGRLHITRKRAVAAAVVSVLAMVILALLVWKAPSGIFLKIYNRLYYFLYPEKDASGLGLQYIQIRRALAVGGMLGPESTRYLFHISEENTDLVFAKLVQTCGMLMGLFVITSYLLMLREGFGITLNGPDSYYRMIAAGIILLIAIQGIVHIGCNICFIPITGIPLPFISHGGVNLTVNLVLSGILMVISGGRMEGRWGHEL